MDTKSMDLEKKLIAELGLDKLPKENQRDILQKIDRALLNRFMANLLTDIPKDKYPRLEQALEKAKENPSLFFEEAIKLHPNAQRALFRSAEEIIQEFKVGQETVTTEKKQKMDDQPSEIDKTKNTTQSSARQPSSSADPEYYQAR